MARFSASWFQTKIMPRPSTTQILLWNVVSGKQLKERESKGMDASRASPNRRIAWRHRLDCAHAFIAEPCETAQASHILHDRAQNPAVQVAHICKPYNHQRPPCTCTHTNSGTSRHHGNPYQKKLATCLRKKGIELNCFAELTSCQATETNDISLQLGFWHFIEQGEW